MIVWRTLKKNRPKSAKMAELGYFEIGCKNTAFWENDFDFEIYESDFLKKN